MNLDDALRAWTTHGGTTLDWTAPDAYTDSVRIAAQFLPPNQAAGFAALRYRDATGSWPDTRAGTCTGPGPCDTSPTGTGGGWVTKAGGLPPYVRAIVNSLKRHGHTESEAVELAIGTIKRWARGEGGVSAATRARAAKALAQWEALKAKAAATPNKRDAAPVTESGSAGLLLPKAGPPMPMMRQAHLPTRGLVRGRCGTCGQPAAAAIHRAATPRRKRTKGARHAGPGHDNVPTGHRTAVRRQTLATIHRHADSVEPTMQRAMAGLFAQQRKATLDRLAGRRGKQMLRAAQDPPPPPDGEQPAPLVDAGQVFDLAHWVAKTRGVLDPVYAAISTLTADRLAAQLGPVNGTHGAIQAVLDARLTRLAQTVNATTFDQIAAALHKGVAEGQSVAQMTKAIEAVFDDAEKNRAATIARTETIGALNHAANAYADHAGPGLVAGREWLAAHDNRVRHTHALADGQIRSLGMPYDVGGFPLMFPGDPTAPPGEVINCRCSQAFLTPHEYAKHTQPAAAAA